MDVLQISCVSLCQFSPHVNSFRTWLHPTISLNLQGGEVLCGQSYLHGLEVCATVTRARHQRDAGLSVQLQVTGQ